MMPPIRFLLFLLLAGCGDPDVRAGLVGVTFETAWVTECVFRSGDQEHTEIGLFAAAGRTASCEASVVEDPWEFDPQNCEEALAQKQATDCISGHVTHVWETLYSAYFQPMPSEEGQYSTVGFRRRGCRNGKMTDKEYLVDASDPDQHIWLTTTPGSDRATVDLDVAGHHGAFDVVYCPLPRSQ